MKHKRIISIVILLLIIGIGSQISFAKGIDDLNPTKMNDAKIFINGIQFKIDKPIYSSKSSVLIPMKLIFEELGANVEWIGETKSIVAFAKDKKIELSINDSVVKVNGQQTLDVELRLIEDVAYIPLNFVEELFGYKVGFDNMYKIITIIDTTKIEDMEKSKAYKSSSEFKDNYIKIEVIKNDRIKVEGKDILDKVEWLFMIKDENDNSIIKEYKKIGDNGFYGDTFSIKDRFNGEYKISVYFKGKADNSYWGYYWDIPIKYEDDELFFPIAPVYLNNYLQYSRSSAIDSNNFLDVVFKNDLEGKEIEELARNIAKDASNDYDKLLKINNWVAENIFYDYDAYKTNQYGATDAYGTFKSKKSVCQGYAELTNALLRSINIPSRIIRGHALGVSAKGRYWNNVDHTKTNHAWNEAFIDGRWIILDTTWNSNNKYENGQYNKSEMSYRYFDPNLEAFSYTHKIINN